MGGLALLARSAGHRVSGSDHGVYPPMSSQLEQQGITLYEGYEADQIEADTELVVIGNALSRGNPAVEHVLCEGLPFASGAQWLGEHFLRGKHVLAVAGTHGKTTTASMLAWMLESAGLEPGFLIGGVPENFSVSARPGAGELFVIEADEYDTAFFDKRSKFVHYRPNTLILNNLEFDHADIFANLAAIRTQFHHLLRTVPGNGLIITNQADENLSNVLDMGCWSPIQTFGSPQSDWHGGFPTQSGSEIVVANDRQEQRVSWALSGEHNLNNAVAAVAAAHHVGVNMAQSWSSLATFKNVKRRLEVVGEIAGVTIFDDFAHHPTAIQTTIVGLRRARRGGKILIALEPRSNSMKYGAHTDQLPAALAEADHVVVLRTQGLQWDPEIELRALGHRLAIAQDISRLLEMLRSRAGTGDAVVFMSNGSFSDAPRRFVTSLEGATA
nr:UDP-N-acetylmuramate--L-alanyl-gamma-D-glutamyl-meso-2,6-diaminoheptandioate ligase-like [Nerophis lumbriciformis]